MPNRFTATEKWKRPWFRDLPPIYKLLWIYLCDSCDPGGVWYIDLKAAMFDIGGDLNRAEAEEVLGKQIVALDCGARWFLPSFIPYQYGVQPQDLNPSNNAHKGAMKALEAVGILSKQPLGSPSLAPSQELRGYVAPIDKEKEVEKEKEGICIKARFQAPSLQEVQDYCRERNRGVDACKWINHYQANGWKVGKNPMKDWRAAVRTWENNANEYRTSRSGVQGRIVGAAAVTPGKFDAIDRGEQ